MIPLNRIRWRPEIGDPSLMGWFTVFAYVAVAVLAGYVWYRRKERIWLLVMLVMLALGINKQFDLQSLFTDIGRVISREQGWFKQRREVQKWFVLGVMSGAALLGGWVFWRFHAYWKKHLLLGAGLLFLGTFIVVRAISFHHFDMILRLNFGGVRMNWMLELGGISLVGLAALREVMRK
ncbi:MAG: hypothetical protein EOP85_18895 [Verrucomicrobiaceae bacterium]|nr:MAG: hypothetical protein EOP85_18895 [Verrucomicrobiaceae bacterium]